MEVSLILSNAYQPVVNFPVTKPTRSSKLLTDNIFAAPLQGVTPAISSNVTQKHAQVRSKPKNGFKQLPNDLPVSHKTRESAILDIQNSSELEAALLRSGEVLKAQDLNRVLRHFGKLNRHEDVCQLFNWMHQHGKTNTASYSSYIKYVGMNSNSMKVLEIYNSIKDESTLTNVSVCNSTLHCLIKSGKFDNSLKLFNKMKQAGLVPDIVTYSTLLVGCTNIKDGYVKAMELVREIKSRGLHMDSVLYGTLISVCASNNQCEEAKKYFDEMKSEGHTPNVFHYSSLLNAYAADGNYINADELIEEMKSEGIVMNKVVPQSFSW